MDLNIEEKNVPLSMAMFNKKNYPNKSFKSSSYTRRTFYKLHSKLPSTCLRAINYYNNSLNREHINKIWYYFINNYKINSKEKWLFKGLDLSSKLHDRRLCNL